MKRLAALPFLIAVPCLAQDDLGARVDAIFANYAKPDSPGCAVGVARTGKTLLMRAALRPSGSGPALTSIAEHRYRIGRNTELRFDGDALHLINIHKPEALYLRVPDATPTAAEIAEYAGTYISDEASAIWKVSVEGGKLTARVTPARASSLDPTYADAFVTEGGDLVLFTRDAAGHIGWRRREGGLLAGRGLGARVERMHFARK